VRVDSIAGRARAAARDLGHKGDSFSLKMLSIRAGMKTRDEHKSLTNAVGDLIKAGVLIRVERGRYAWKDLERTEPTIQEKMWRALRSARVTDVEELQELAGASEDYAREWLQMLARRKIVRRLKGGKWQMIEDQVEMPADEEKAERLRRMRRKRKEAQEAMDRAFAAIAEARIAIADMEE